MDKRVIQLYNDWEKAFLNHEEKQEVWDNLEKMANDILPHRQRPYRPVLCYAWWVSVGYAQGVTSTGLPVKYSERIHSK